MKEEDHHFYPKPYRPREIFLSDSMAEKVAKFDYSIPVSHFDQYTGRTEAISPIPHIVTLTEDQFSSLIQDVNKL